jgi:hypothetical protein
MTASSSPSSKQLQLFLMPTPGAKPEFLATVQHTNTTKSLDSSLPDKIVLENYTRDAWAWKPNPTVWQSYTVVSVDGRNKLPGFLSYLKERRKSAFGRFADNKAAVVVISYIQPASLAKGEMECRLAWDCTTVPGCPLKPTVTPKQTTSTAPAKPATATATSIRKGKAGLLGKLVSSQRRTNAHVQQSITTKPKQPAIASNDTSTTTTTSDPSVPTRTAQQVMAEFRQEMEQKMLDFDLADDQPILQVTVALQDYQKNLATPEDEAKITMEILKYIVYEQAEEINEEWVAHKDSATSEEDEMTINIYKPGEAPPEVLEEMNMGELPDEVKGQQAAVAAQAQNRADQKARQAQLELQRKALQEKAAHDDDEVILNTNKRDRRTIEDIQRGIGLGESSNKKAKTS